MIQEFFQKIVETWWYKTILAFVNFFLVNRFLIIPLYLVVFALSVVRISYTRKTFFSIIKKANMDLDIMRYEISKILYNHQNTIHKPEETIPLLLHYKNKTIETTDPRENIDKLYEEYCYICNLTQEHITIEKSNLLVHKKIITKLQKTEKSLISFLAFMTLWLSKFFL